MKCPDKKPYPTYKMAAQAMSHRMKVDPSRWLRCYKCPECRHWHIMHQRTAEELGCQQ